MHVESVFLHGSIVLTVLIVVESCGYGPGTLVLRCDKTNGKRYIYEQQKTGIRWKRKGDGEASRLSWDCSYA